MIVLPVEMLLVVGTAVVGASGVLLSVAAPFKTCNVPVLATLLNGRSKTIGALVATVFEIYKRCRQLRVRAIGHTDLDDNLARR